MVEPWKGVAVILDLNHINITSPKLEETRDFFVKVLGLKVGPRPNVPFDGYWLYAGDKALVHLQSFDRLAGARGASGPLDHAAFDVADLKVAKQSLSDHGVAFTELNLPGTGRGQLFFIDPNGVNLEIGGPAEQSLP